MASLSDRLTQNNRKPAGTPARSSGVRAVVFLVLALFAAAGAGLLFRNYLERSSLGRAMPTEKVVVAALDIPLATTLRAEQLTTIDWPKASLPQGTASDPAKLVGRVVLAGLVKGEPLLEAKLASEKAGQGLAAVLPEEMRAVAVRVDDVVGVAGFIHPGDAVDVIVTMKASESSNVPPTSKVILQNVRVLAVGKELDHKNKKQKAVPVTVATLMVSSPDSEKLALASTKGKILLALRNRIDASEVETPGIIPAVLLDGAPSEPAEEKPQEPGKPRPRRVVARKPAVKPPVKPQPGEHQVEILRGDRFETRQFSTPEPKP